MGVVAAHTEMLGYTYRDNPHILHIPAVDQYSLRSALRCCMHITTSLKHGATMSLAHMSATSYPTHYPMLVELGILTPNAPRAGRPPT